MSTLVLADKRRLNVLILVGFALLFWRCEKINDPKPLNPYSTIIRNTDTNNEPLPDSATIEGLHYYIFERQCATPGCHDGHFEPDFRTVQSSYATLVWQKPVKNTADFRFKYRVWPSQADSSWLIERCITDDPVLGRMPLYSPQLKPGELTAMRRWINNGARNVDGSYPVQANLSPILTGFVITDRQTGIRLDTSRVRDGSQAIRLRPNQTVDCWFAFTDDSTARDALRNGKMLLATGLVDGWEQIGEIALTKAEPPLVVRHYYGRNRDETFFYKATINTASYPVRRQHFFRVTIEDQQGNATLMPRNETRRALKLRYSWVIVP